MSDATENNTEKCIAFIARHGRARSPDIADHIGRDSGAVAALLTTAVKAGYLVACKVEQPGKPACNEYRISEQYSETKTSWREFKLRARQAGTPTSAKAARPPVDEPPRAANPNLPPARMPPPPTAHATRQVRAPFSTTFTAAPPAPLRAVLDSDGQLTLHLPDADPIVLDVEQTRTLGQFMVDTHPAWN